jgi:hypothetical protein
MFSPYPTILRVVSVALIVVGPREVAQAYPPILIKFVGSIL